MPSSVIDIEKQALGLTPEQRAHLADKLLSSLSPDPGVEEAWSAEALRRLGEIENGSVTGVPVEDAIARAQCHSMIVSTHPLAEEELTSGAVYYANRVNPALGQDFIAEFERSVAPLRQYPEIGSPWRGALRRLPIRRFPYSIVYYQSGDVLRIVAMAHQEREPGYWRGRV